MKILKKHLVRVWYEDKEGNKYIPTADESAKLLDPPKEYNFQVTRFPLELTTTYLRLNRSNGQVISSTVVMKAHQTINEALATAIIQSGDFTLSESLMVVAICCERCMNVLAWKYNLGWGYREHSESWNKAKTSCQFCKQ